MAFVSDFLSRLGFDSEAIRVYLVLIKHGPITLLEASRQSGIERTRLYRLIDTWLSAGLIEEQLAYKTRLIRAADITKISNLVTEKKLQTELLETALPKFTSLINSISNSDSSSKILYYNGKKGLQDICWNVLRAKSKIRSCVYRSSQEAFGQYGFNRWAEEYIQSKIPLYEIRHPDFLKTVNQPGLKYKHLGPKYHWRNAPKAVKITHGLDIYNDVVAISYWKPNGEYFGLEMYNHQIASMQASFFDIIWNIAKKS